MRVAAAAVAVGAHSTKTQHFFSFFFFNFELIRATLEDLWSAMVNLRASCPGASAAPTPTTLAYTPRLRTTSDGSTGSLRAAEEGFRCFVTDFLNNVPPRRLLFRLRVKTKSGQAMYMYS